MEELDVKQVLYKAINSPQFGRSSFNKLVNSKDTFGEYTDVVSAVRNHYFTYKTPISREGLATEIKFSDKKRGKLNKDRVLEIDQKLAKIYNLSKAGNYSNDPNLDKNIDDWCRSQVALAVLRSYAVQNKDFGDQKVLLDMLSDIKEAAQIGSTDSLFEKVDITGDDPKELVNRLDNIVGETIPTGWTDLDKAMGGGLARGEVGATEAYTGTGKSTTLINLMAQYGVVEKKDVLYISMEDATDRMYYRMLANITRTGYHELYDDNNILLEDNAYKLVKEIQEYHRKGAIGSLELLRSNPHEVSPVEIEQAIQEYQGDHGKAPDILMIDYPDIMLNPYATSNTDPYSAEGKLYEEIRRIAGVYHMIVWVAMQSGRGARDAKVLTGFDVEGSKKKINALDLNLTVNQTPEERKEGYIRLYMDKVRNPSQATNDGIIYLKVNPKGVRFQNENEEERHAHQELLASSEDFGAYKKEPGDRKKAYDDANKKIAQANKEIKGLI